MYDKVTYFQQNKCRIVREIKFHETITQFPIKIFAFKKHSSLIKFLLQSTSTIASSQPPPENLKRKIRVSKFPMSFEQNFGLSADYFNKQIGKSITK